MSLYVAWQSLGGRSSASLSEFLALAEQAEVHDVAVDGQDMGAILVIGPEIHACVIPAAFGRWFNRRAMGVLQGVIDRHGYATTSVTAGNEIGHRFVTRLGFERVATEPIWKYRKEK